MRTNTAAVVVLVLMMTTHNVGVARGVGPVCLEAEGRFAPYQDAKAAIQILRKNTEECCNSVAERRCSILGNTLEAALYICGGQWCIPCNDAGKYLKNALEHCKTKGQVQAAYVLGGTDRSLYVHKVGTI